MKTSVAIFCAALIFCTFATMKASCQATALAYAGVEILEAASAISSPITSFEIKNDRGSYSDNSVGQSSSATNQLNLGEIRINSSSAVACNMVINPAKLYDTNGNDLQVTLSAKTSDNSTGMCTKGSETVRLNGTAQLSQNQATGFYSGSYTLVFAFN
ncbi:MAG: hypothetical protein NT004_11190 [Bacteroidetes bacterium]|nr:hypothetical protein [Bacteroidota bacterium]